MMTGEERIRALQELGYLRREAEFLLVAALHSGFFLRRQYRDFLDTKPGYADDLLIARMTNLGHGRTMMLGHRTQVCHLSSRPFYTAIGEPDNRHRRMRSELSMKVKLMALDYVLAHPGPMYLATEEEKIDFFCAGLGFSRSCLPVKIYRSKRDSSTTERYFVDKFPISVPAGPAGSPLVVSFCYIDEGSVATPGFETWLLQHGELFKRLVRYRVVYVATRETRFVWAENLFRRFSLSLPSHDSGAINGSDDRLLNYFRLEDAFSKREFERLDAQKLDELKRLRNTFGSNEIERLFKVWQEAGNDAVIRYLD